MRADEAHVYHPKTVIDPDHNPILVARDVEYDASIAQYTCVTKIRFYVLWFSPICFQYGAESRVSSGFGVIQEHPNYGAGLAEYRLSGLVLHQ